MKSRLLCTALLLATALGCEEDEAEPIAAEDFCSAYALALCEGFEDCCLMRDDGTAVGGVGTFDSCLRANASYCELELITPEDLGRASPGGGLRVALEYDAQGAGNALASIRSAAASCIEPPFIFHNDIHLQGGKGEPCLENADCAEDFACAGAGPTAAGVCADAPVEGQACESRCAGSLLCLDEVCVKPRREGQSCAFRSDCVDGLFCFYEDGGFPNGNADGVCVELRAEGAACEENIECASGYCAGDIVCRDADEDEELPWCFVDSDGPLFRAL